MASSGSKINALETQVAEYAATVNALKLAPATSAAPTLPTIDNVIAGDSIVKHVDVDLLQGVNKLICLPGARPRQVHLAVRKLAKTANIKNLVLHYGTNSIALQSPLAVCREIADSLHRVQVEMPNTNIHFSAILPKIDSSFNRTINFINNFVCDLSNDMEIGFINHSSFSQHGHLNKKLFSPTEWKDMMPIHPSHEGALLLSTNYKMHLLNGASPAE